MEKEPLPLIWGGGGGGDTRAAVYPPDNETLAKLNYEVHITNGPGPDQTVTTAGSTRVTVRVQSGTWDIQAQAFLEGALYAKGAASVTIKAGQNNSAVSIQMRLAAGAGLPTHTVTFDKNHRDPSGYTEASPAAKTAASGGTVGTLPSAPTRSGGWYFSNWNTQADGGGTVFTASTPVTGDLTVYAQWTTVTYTVTFDKNHSDPSGYAEADPAAKTAASGGTVDMLPSAPTRSGGWYFSNWNTQADGGGTAFTASTPVTGDLTVYAQWTHLYTVTYDGNGSTGGSVPVDSGSYLNGAVVTVRGNTGSLERTGYVFAGWNTQSDGNGTDYAASGSVAFTMGTENALFYAKWTAVSYTVTFNRNHGDTSGYADATPATKPVTYPATTVGTLPIDPTRSDYILSGWTINSDGTGGAFTAATAVTGDLTVYAQWTISPVVEQQWDTADFGGPANEYKDFSASDSDSDLQSYLNTKASSGQNIAVTVEGTHTLNPVTTITGTTAISLRGSGTIRLGTNGSLFTVDSGTGKLILRGPVLVGRNSTDNGANNNAPLIKVNNGDLFMHAGKISGNTYNGNGGGVYMGNTGNFTMSGTAVITNNSGSIGGGVHHSSNGLFTLSGMAAITSNNSQMGGGVYMTNNGNIAMSGGTINNNFSNQGGALYHYGSGTFTMSGGTITGNTGNSYGGVYVRTGTFTINTPATVGATGSISGNAPGNMFKNGGTVDGTAFSTPPTGTDTGLW